MIVTARICVQPEFADEAEVRLKEMVAQVRQEPDTLIYTLHKDLKTPGTYYFFEKYKDAEAFKSHSKTQYFQDLFAWLNDKLTEPPEIRMSAELASL